MKAPLILILYSILLTGCHFQDSTKILSEAESLIKEYPDSALKVIRKIDFPTELSEKDLADYGRLQSLSHYSTGKSLAEDSLILFSLKYYKAHADSGKLIETYDLVSEYYWWRKDYRQSLTILDEGILWAKKTNNSKSISHFYFSKAYLLYSKEKNYLEALENFEQSHLYNKTPFSYYLDALCRFSLKKDSIGYFIEKGVELALLEKDTLYACHFLRNYADILINKGELNEAIRQIERTYVLSDYYRNFSMTNAAMSEIQLKWGNLDSAQHFLNIAKENRYTNSFGSLSRVKDLSFENYIVQLQGIIDYSQNRTIDFGDMGRFNDSIFVSRREQYKLLEGKVEAQHSLEQQNFKLKLVRKQTQIWVILACLLIVISSGFIYLFIRKKHQKLMDADERIETLKRLLNDALLATSENDSKSHFFKKMLLQQLGVIRLFATSPSSKNQELLRQMASITNEEIPVDSLLVWEDLYPVIDSIYEGFYSNMLQLYGNILIEKEIQLCCLLCADFSTKEINVVTQQSIPTIYQRKTTIRRKLNMDEKEDIIEFMKQQIESKS